MNKILEQKLNWNPNLENERDFICNLYDKEKCYLRMNNFPEEPLWTLFYEGQSIDIDDTPPNWNITYRSEIEN